MTATTAQRPNGAARPPETGRSLSQARIEEIRKRRQARGALSDYGRQKLAVDEAAKDPLWAYRWVNDSQMRILDMQGRDWEFAPAETTAGDEHDTGIGTRIERIVNERTTQTAEKAFLMRKPKEFLHEDQKRRRQSRASAEKDLSRGVVDDPQAQVERGYIPRSGMKIANGSYQP